MNEPSSLRVVVPARNAAWCIEACLHSLIQAGFAGNEIFVVNNGSNDATAELAQRSGAVVISDPNSLGAGAARNCGARAAGGEMIFFVDADVAVQSDVRTQLLAFFKTNPDVDAVFGAYDDAPSCPSPSSKYRNLLHHYVHQHGPSRPRSFWTGCGAVRRATFDPLGGFDETQRMMEDVEFGIRLTNEGGIVALEPAIRGKHLKTWTILGIVRTDLFDRAIPWARLMLFGPGLSTEFNLGGAHRLSAALTAMIWLSLLAAPLAPLLVALTALCGVGFIVVNLEFLLLVRRCAGLKTALAAIPLHILHYTCALVGFGWVYLAEYLPRSARSVARSGYLRSGSVKR